MRAWSRGVRIPLTVILVSAAAGAAIALWRTATLRLGSGPPPRSQLAEQVDGGAMEKYLESSSQKETILRWIANGARRDEWEAVEPILLENCVSCHDAVTMPTIVPRNQYSFTARVATVRSVLAEKVEWSTMTRYLEGPGEKETLLRWIDNGAPENGWAEIGRILMERCVFCHNPETGVPGLVSLDRYHPAARLAIRPQSELAIGEMAASIAVFVLATAGLVQMWRKKSDGNPDQRSY